MRTWGYIQNAVLAKLDLSSEEAASQGLVDRFFIYANEAMMQICSSIKPKYTFAEFAIHLDDVGKPMDMPEDFVSFGADINCELKERKEYVNGELIVKLDKRELDDYDFEYYGTNQVIFNKPGLFKISYNALWFEFYSTLNTFDEITAPNDVLDCLPSYIASQCYKVDDEVKSSIYRNEYEMFLARIDNTNYRNTSTIKVGGGW